MDPDDKLVAELRLFNHVNAADRIEELRRIIKQFAHWQETKPNYTP